MTGTQVQVQKSIRSITVLEVTRWFASGWAEEKERDRKYSMKVEKIRIQRACVKRVLNLGRCGRVRLYESTSPIVRGGWWDGTVYRVGPTK
jgi:hypothetical protein